MFNARLFLTDRKTTNLLCEEKDGLIEQNLGSFYETLMFFKSIFGLKMYKKQEDLLKVCAFSGTQVDVIIRYVLCRIPCENKETFCVTSIIRGHWRF